VKRRNFISFCATAAAVSSRRPLFAAENKIHLPSSDNVHVGGSKRIEDIGFGRRRSAVGRSRFFSYTAAPGQTTDILKGLKTFCPSMELNFITTTSSIRPTQKSPTTPRYGQFGDTPTKWKQSAKVSVWINSIYWDIPGAASSRSNMH
jgi:hypothetical protein